MSQTIHLCLDIAGILQQARRDPEMVAFLFKDTSAQEAIRILEENLAIGRKKLPFCECEGFDYRTGCPGHPVEATSPKENK